MKDLIDAYLDGRATPEQLAQLDAALRKDEDLRLEFVESANLIAELSEVLCGNEPELETPKPMRWWPLAAAAVLAIGLFALSRINTQPLPQPQAQPEAQLASPTSLMPADAAVLPGNAFEPPCRLQVATRTEFVYPDGSRLTLAAGTALRAEAGPSKALFLEQGSLEATVHQQETPMTVESAHSKVTVLGTAFRLTTAQDSDEFELQEGKVRLRENRTGDERDISPGAIYQVGAAEARLSLRPAASYTHGEWWFHDDFEPTLLPRLWAMNAYDAEGFHPLKLADGEVEMVETVRNGDLNNAMKLARWRGSEAAVALRLDHQMKWDNFRLRFRYQVLEGAPLTLQVMADGESDELLWSLDHDAITRPGTWTEIQLEYVKYWDGRRWAAEVRQFVGDDFQDSVQVPWDRPYVFFTVSSGACLLDHIRLRQLVAEQ